MIVEDFNIEKLMATVNFSVPDDVKRVFDETFRGRNKSAVIARLMVEAVEEERKKEARAEAIDRLLARRAGKETVTDSEVRRARAEPRRWP